MLTYWLMFLLPASVALSRSRYHDEAGPSRALTSWVMIWAALWLLIGFRYRVGGDWETYLESFMEAKFLSIGETIALGDPAYGIVNWISVYLDWNIYGVNVVCALLFSTGLVVFCLAQPRPWLALVVAIPYLVIVVAMGYSRQGVAIGLAMIALVELGRGKNLRFVLWIAFAALFHKSAVILAPLAILTTARGRWWVTIWVGATSALLYFLLLEQHQEGLYMGYIEAEYQSEGATVRVWMNAVPAVILLLARKRLVPDPAERRLWTTIAAFAVIFLPLLWISPSSTAIDRTALYLIPLQLYVFSRAPDLLGPHAPLAAFLVVLYSALVQFVWLNFAIHAHNWIPYSFYLLEIST